MHMAVDEALFVHAGRAVLRFYRWRQPAISFGYFGSYAEAVAEGPGHEIVRRWTGGGMVLHGEDLTYSLVLPRHGDRPLPPARVVYFRVHDAIRRALAPLATGFLAADDAPRQSAACFANAVRADVLIAGRKIAGAAQRRTRSGLLHQGSIQFERLPAHFSSTFASLLCAKPANFLPGCHLLSVAEELAARKYGCAAWLQRC